MKINRVWAMPNKNTFKIKPIHELIEKYMDSNKIWIDPFARTNQFKCITNDLNTNFNTDYNLESLDFLNMFESNYVDGVLFDPPYSPRQMKESYQSIGLKMTQEQTQSRFYSKRKAKIAKILKPNGVCISFGWNSNGIGKTKGFEIIEILLVSHGSNHNDTICTVERKLFT
tara:strand:+ start:580 stop:1092 length:513 start_codon:yes stop_codon:yes gene_type:complete